MKILASDFDNTLYIEDVTMMNKNIVAIKQFLLQGNLFCIITGRNYSEIKIDLNKHNIPYTYLICGDGAKIFNNMDYCLKTNLISPDKVDKVKRILIANGYKYYLDDGYNQTENIQDCVKVVAYLDDRRRAEEVIATIKEKVEVYAYISTEHINITDIEVNKSNSLKQLLNIENLSSKDLYVIGDEQNDYEMLKSYSGAVMTKHAKVLDELHKKEYNYLYQYIEELSKN